MLQGIINIDIVDVEFEEINKPMGLDIYFNKGKTPKSAEEQIGYFRKVNFLVSFFEQYGFDTPNQTPLEIDIAEAQGLLESCDKVLEDYHKNNNFDLAKKLLPTCSGFFFGNTDYDNYYLEDVRDVRDFCFNTLIPEFEELEDGEHIYFNTWY